MVESLLRVAACLMICGSASASLWVDPDFETLVGEAELIAVVEVVEGGEYASRVKPLDALKGRAPARSFEVKGYNNYHWPKEGRAKESLHTGAEVRDRRLHAQVLASPFCLLPADRTVPDSAEARAAGRGNRRRVSFGSRGMAVPPARDHPVRASRPARTGPPPRPPRR